MRTRILLVLTFALITLTLACSKSNAPDSKPSATNSSGVAPAANPTAAGPAATSAMKIDLKLDPAQPAPNKDAIFTARLTNPDGSPVTGADVNVALTMKEMDMGKTDVKLADKGNGNYDGKGKFTMSGDWNAAVTAKQADKTATQTVTV